MFIHLRKTDERKIFGTWRLILLTKIMVITLYVVRIGSERLGSVFNQGDDDSFNSNSFIVFKNKLKLVKIKIKEWLCDVIIERVKKKRELPLAINETEKLLESTNGTTEVMLSRKNYNIKVLSDSEKL